METRSRLLFLDQFRGLAILLMVFGNAMAHYDSVPAYLQHAPADGFTLPDIVMPMFFFAMGYAAELSFLSRVKRDGASKTVSHLLFRNFVLIGYGILGTLLVKDHPWDILEALGAAGLLAIPLLFLQPAVRLTLAVISLVAYQAGISFFFNPTGADSYWHGAMAGALATFSWIFILVAGSCLSAWLKGKVYTSKIVWPAVAGAILIAAGAALNPFIPFNKHLGSISYILLSTGSCACGLMLLMVLSERFHLSLPPLQAMGRNALVLYMLSCVLIVVENIILPAEVSLLVCVGGFAAVLLLTYLTGAILDWKKIYVKL
jgi:predicted acyltransferase